MNTNVLLYIAVMAAVTYLIRALPLTLIRKPIRNRFLRSFLHYVPYVTLTVMTIPGILSSTGSVISASVGLAAALLLAYRDKSLIQVALGGGAAVLVVELIQSLL